MSVPRPWPRRPPILFLWVAIGTGLNAILGLVRVVIRPGAGLLGWPYAAIWAISSVLALWQWRRNVKAFHNEFSSGATNEGAEPSR